MNKALLIFPNQLFLKHPAFEETKNVFLVEHPRFFSDFRFHKLKLVFHRASMKVYSDELRKKGFKITYIEHSKVKRFFGKLKKIDELHIADPIDNSLKQDIKKTSQKFGFSVVVHESPSFLTPIDFINEHFAGKKHYSMTSFYIAQRKRMNVLLKTGKPVGGKWTFDVENRLPLPKTKPVPEIKFPKKNKYVKEAVRYVNKKFAGNYGTAENFWYPITRADAKSWMRQFVKKRLKDFGTYEDAMRAEESILFHSVLSPLLNTGILTPKEVLDAALRSKAPINSLEGFVRQVIGWREFVRAVYVIKGEQERGSNFLKHNRKLSKKFWHGETGLPPVDIVIERVLKHAYAHHIERLMILGNIMLLCESKPDDVYKWFMELFIDSYDWVMVPNVYGMSQFADGGLITTKPYTSSSKYVKRMSDFKTGDWCEEWDGLFWRFIDKHKAFLKKNPRMAMLVRTWQRMPRKKRKDHLRQARRALKRLST